MRLITKPLSLIICSTFALLSYAQAQYNSDDQFLGKQAGDGDVTSVVVSPKSHHSPLQWNAEMDFLSVVDDRGTNLVRANVLRVSPIISYTFPTQTKALARFSFLSGGAESHNGGDAQTGSALVDEAHVTHNIAGSDRFQIRVGYQWIPIGHSNPNPSPLNRLTVDRAAIESNIIPERWHENGIQFQFNHEEFHAIIGAYNSFDAEDLNASGNYISDSQQDGTNAKAESVMGALRLEHLGDYHKVVLSGMSGTGRQDSNLDEATLSIVDFHFLIDWESIRFLGQYIDASYKDAAELPNLGFYERAAGYRANLGFDLLSLSPTGQKLILFGEYTAFNLNEELPENGIADETLDKEQSTIGFNYMPEKSVVYKIHYTARENASEEEEDILQFGASVVF